MVYDTSLVIKNTKGVMSPRKIKSWVHIVSSGRKIIHFHNSGLGLKVLAILPLVKISGAKFIITYHSLRDNVGHLNWFTRKAISIIFRSVSHFIASNPDIRQKLLLLSAAPERISVIPAFLPPTVKEQEIDEIPKEVWNFMDNHNPVISANAFRIILSEGQDRYGIDMCIDLCANLRSASPRIGFVFCLPDIGDYEYFSRMEQRIAQKRIGKSFLFVTKPYQFYPILMKSDVFVRPTNTDGDAVSLREALYFKVPSVASDAVPRPEGTILFENRDVGDFTSKVRHVLDNYEWYKNKLERIKTKDTFEEIWQVYQRVIYLAGNRHKAYEPRFAIPKIAQGVRKWFKMPVPWWRKNLPTKRRWRGTGTY